MVDPPVKFKTIKGHALATDANFGHQGPHLGVEAVAIHAEVTWGIAEAQEARGDSRGFIRFEVADQRFELTNRVLWQKPIPRLEGIDTKYEFKLLYRGFGEDYINGPIKVACSYFLSIVGNRKFELQRIPRTGQLRIGRTSQLKHVLRSSKRQFDTITRRGLIVDVKQCEIPNRLNRKR